MNHDPQQVYSPVFYATGSQYEMAEKEYVDHAPVWCSVDLRDGNQALVVPMSLEQKVQFFQLLVKIGFKEIEVGFPAASDTEYQFLRTLIEQDLIPDDVTIQVLTQAREHIIRKTFEALEGAKHAIVHVYNSTSLAQREQVFHKSKEEILQIAVEGAKLLKELAEEAHANYRFEYSPESFTGTEIDYAAEVCNAVLDIWQPTADNKAIINLPSTVQMSMPHVYASQIEYMNDHLKYRENVVLSLHPHNDRGCGISDAEMGILAGADRIEGTLFGNGERTGNVDIITLALNMYAQGVDPELDFSDMPYITEHYEEYTGMKVDERSPYGGGLVFAAFSGSHQDTIAKGMKYREAQVRYLDGSVSADRPDRYRSLLRCGCHPDQQPVRKGRRRLYSGAALWTEASEEDARGDGLCGKRRIRRAAQGTAAGRNLPDFQEYLREHHRAVQDRGSTLQAA